MANVSLPHYNPYHWSYQSHLLITNRPYLSKAENDANYAGYIPLIGSLVGIGRIFYGFSQIYHAKTKSGLLNVGRGVIEFIPFSSHPCQLYDLHIKHYEGSVGTFKEERLQRLVAQCINYWGCCFIVG